MGFYDVDYSNAGDAQVTPGIYEVYVSDYSISRAQSGNLVVNLFYTVRDDIQQPNVGSKINYDRFTEVQAAKWRFDRAAKAAGIPDNTPINSAQDWANLMVNRDLKVKVEMGQPNNKGNSYPEVKDFFLSDFPSVGRPMPILEHAYAQPQQNYSQNDYSNAANRIGQNNYGNPSNQFNNPNQQFGRTSQDITTPAYSIVSQQNSQMNGANFQSQQNKQGSTQSVHGSQNNQQGSMPGVDPVQDNRSFANGGFNGSMISDDDLPF
ncbi:hypothetical protein CI088_00110 [Enterococcus plantarum]|uniref:DUF669 domain-containing protein n=1 Tax=Enterococcus plantarum TaxID=1077675 RepID=A0A2W3ZLE1_9ENTE|nr:DUF669 domain-containing protein [Enterococcus plantarum]PZL78210.1 hypothetical protein CI088_00110 [Enterococcus plantarum]